MRHKRQLRKKEQIRELIEQGSPYVPINNRIFDDLYEQEKITFQLLVGIQFQAAQESTFTDLDLIIYVFLTFLQRNKITLYIEEMADYLNCSSKQLRTSIQKMQGIKVDINVEGTARLITEKVETAFEAGKRTKAKVWYPNFTPEKIEDEGEEKAVKYFNVTIRDFDLLTQGKLDRKEFVLYLFLLRLDTDNGQNFYISHSKIAERLKIKGVETTLVR